MMEVIVATLNPFFQHYAQPTGISITLQATLENIQIELVVADYPLNYKVKVWDPLATESWIKALWENSKLYNIDVVLKYRNIALLQDHDSPIVQLMVG